jgi:hypothetical protein
MLEGRERTGESEREKERQSERQSEGERERESERDGARESERERGVNKARAERGRQQGNTSLFTCSAVKIYCITQTIALFAAHTCTPERGREKQGEREAEREKQRERRWRERSRERDPERLVLWCMPFQTVVFCCPVVTFCCQKRDHVERRDGECARASSTQECRREIE